MKVLNLQCADQHRFEGWFGSEEDFQSQMTRGLVECPLCSNTVVHKLPSAPRLNLLGAAAIGPSRSRVSDAAPQLQSGQKSHFNESAALAVAVPAEAAHAAYLSAVHQLLENTEDVGQRFAEEARRIHYGETEGHNIRGQTSRREAADLMEEGIEVMQLPLPAALKHTLQ